MKFNGGDGGRINHIQKDKLTAFIGSLYEVDSDGSTRKHIFLGSARLATISSTITLSPVGGEGKGEGVKSFFHSDHLGSTSLITNSKGDVIRKYEYKPFGEVFSEDVLDPSSDIPNFLYTGKRLDKDTGLYYYGARYYDPKLGRFTQADTIVPNPSNPQDLNRYSYTGNNPINYTDPTGNFRFKDWAGKIIGGVVGIVTLVMTGNPALAWAAYGFVSGSIDAYNAGYSVGQSIGIGVAVGTASYLGGKIGGAFGSWVGSGSVSASALGSAIFSGAGAGAAGGATGAALTGGDVGTAAWQGAAISGTMALFGYGLTYRGPPAAQDQTQQQVKQSANDKDFQQANDIGAENGPEGRLAAAEDVARSALRPGIENPAIDFVSKDIIGQSLTISTPTSPTLLLSGANLSVMDKMRGAQLLFHILWALIGKGKPPNRPDPVTKDGRSGYGDTYDPKSGRSSGFGPKPH